MIIREAVYEEAITNYGPILLAECTTSSKLLAVYFIYVDLNDSLEELNFTFPTVKFIEGTVTQKDRVVKALNDLSIDDGLKMHFKCENEFTMKVLEEIKKIPKGETRSYKQIATSLGKPDSFRAVARACSTNNFAVIIPCHRVLASNGAISGYRWGIDKKREILDAEGVVLQYSVM